MQFQMLPREFALGATPQCLTVEKNWRETKALLSLWSLFAPTSHAVSRITIRAENRSDASGRVVVDRSSGSTGIQRQPLDCFGQGRHSSQCRQKITKNRLRDTTTESNIVKHSESDIYTQALDLGYPSTHGGGSES